jgi:LuxR family maltose regulon positive regulatory protein
MSTATLPATQVLRAPLLQTKLLLPPVRSNRVERPRLFAQLDAGLAKPLMLVCAPAGYGKTTLVSSWLRTLSLPAAWLALDEDDNDPLRFLQSLAAALEQIVPALPGDALPADLATLLQARQPTPWRALLPRMLNPIAAQAAPVVLVLDDVHLLQAPPVLDLLAFVLEHLPPVLHLVLLSRVDPPLPLARLRVRDQLMEIRADRLRFTPEESARFLRDGMGLSLSGDEIATLERRVEGWIAGWQLAALSLQGTPDVAGFVAAFSGSHRYIMDYLAEEVLTYQPEPVRTFLLQTSILARLCGPLCRAVAGGNAADEDAGNVVDGQAMLELLEQKNLFVTPLDGERRWYRYHPLFADVLNRHLERLLPDQVPELHRRASLWFEQQMFIPEAVHHALLARDHEHAVELVEQHGCALLLRGEGGTLLDLLARVERQGQLRPWPTVLKAWALALSGHLDEVEPTLQPVEPLLAALEPTPMVQEVRGCMAALRAHRANQEGDTELAAHLAQQALDHLPECDPLACTLRSVAILVLGDASRVNGDLAAAQRAYREARRISQVADNLPMSLIAETALGEMLVEQGHLHQAAQLFSESLQRMTEPDGRVSPAAAGLYAGLSRVAYAWNDLEAAARYARQGLTLSRRSGDHDLEAVAHVFLARLGRAQGHLDQVQAAMQAAEHLLGESALSPNRSVWVQAALAHVCLVQGQPEPARQFVLQRGLTPEDEIPYRREAEYLVLVRLLLAQGDYGRARALAGRVRVQAEAAPRIGRVIEGLLLQALVYQGQQEYAQALAHLEQAFVLAQPERYVRPFLDEGEAMAKLLQRAKTHGLAPHVAAELLAALDSDGGSPRPFGQGLVEPLTERELEVLQRIAAGDSNQEIAEHLVISPATVKRHISNLYGKLGAASRTQALALARDRGLLR